MSEKIRMVGAETPDATPDSETDPRLEASSDSWPDQPDQETSLAPGAQASADGQSLSADPDLIADFMGESQEYLERAEVELLILESTPDDATSLNTLFGLFHTLKGLAGFLDRKEIGDLAHRAEDLLDMARSGRLILAGPALELVFEILDVLKRLVNRMSVAPGARPETAETPDVLSLMTRIRTVIDAAPSADRSALDSEESCGAVTGTTDAGCALTSRQVDSASDPLRHDAAPVRFPQHASPPPSTRIRETIRVDEERLDRLLDGISEMVITEAMVNRSAMEVTDASTPLGRQLQLLSKAARQLQELSLSMRMTPLRATFRRMTHLAHALAKDQGKLVEFVISGEDRELDKSIVDQIGNPLMHLVRNAIDHGLESPDQRRAAGKPEVGRLELRALHREGAVVIEVEDDGQGLDLEAILSKARSSGTVPPETMPDDRRLLALVFDPGFSTTREVSEVSGRGVGLDVVRKSVEQLGGDVSVRSEAGKGSVFTLCLPLTLAIIDGLVTRVGSERYIIPSYSIVRSIKPEAGNVVSIAQRGMILSLADEVIPLLPLARLLDVVGEEGDPGCGVVVVVESQGRRVGLIIDELLGKQQVVIRPLRGIVRNLQGLAAACILPDGCVGLILDVEGLQGLARERRER